MKLSHMREPTPQISFNQLLLIIFQAWLVGILFACAVVTYVNMGTPYSYFSILHFGRGIDNYIRGLPLTISFGMLLTSPIFLAVLAFTWFLRAKFVYKTPSMIFLTPVLVWALLSLYGLTTRNTYPADISLLHSIASFVWSDRYMGFVVPLFPSALFYYWRIKRAVKALTMTES